VTLALEQFTNNASTTLNGGINNAVTSLVVTSASSFPTAGNFRILIDSELILVTAVSGTTFTISRAVEGTAAASHSNGATITEIITAASLIQAVQDRTAIAPFTPPIDANFSWINQGTATTASTVNPNGVYFLAPAISGGSNMIVRYVAAPATPYHVQTYIQPTFLQNDYAWGLVFVESGSGKMVSHFMQQSDSPAHAKAAVVKHPSATTGGSYYTGFPLIGLMFPNWFRVGDDGTNLTFDFSPDGNNWWNMFTVSRTDYLTTGPNQVGFFLYPSNAVSTTIPLAALVAHWKVTA
jgi:hypothetical protein